MVNGGTFQGTRNVVGMKWGSVGRCPLSGILAGHQPQSGHPEAGGGSGSGLEMDSWETLLQAAC